MKNKIIEFIIVIVGAIFIFVIFAFDPFLDKIIDNSQFTFPWWVWGIIGVVLYTAFCIYIYTYKKKFTPLR